MRRYYSVGELARELGVSRTWIHVMIWRRKLRPSIRVGNIYGFSRSAVQAAKSAVADGFSLTHVTINDAPPPEAARQDFDVDSTDG